MPETEHSLERSTNSYRYYRNAVERHWDPYAIDLEDDRDALASFDFDEGEDDFEYLRMTLALFGAGEEAVTEDLAPLATALEGIEDEMFVTTQMYEEAKHADFFDRYWREVVNPVEETLGYEVTSPTYDRFFNDDYYELFERNERAMGRLLEDDTPENRVRAHAHYHLTIEGILAQTGYYGIHQNFSDDVDDYPNLPGLVEGFSNIRSDEGRHVGFGMHKIKQHLTEDGVDVSVLNDTVGELMPLTNGIVVETTEPESPGIGRAELTEFAAEKHRERMEQITSADAEIPDVDELVRLSGV
ncbi:MAG: ribonucleotide-diphosphate reductase subunit beta [Halobacteriales archaeon]